MKKQKTPPQQKVLRASLEESFVEVVGLIQQARQRAFQAVNTEIIDLYWQVGETINRS